jgi:hypothetical protein
MKDCKYNPPTCGRKGFHFLIENGQPRLITREALADVPEGTLMLKILAKTGSRRARMRAERTLKSELPRNQGEITENLGYFLLSSDYSKTQIGPYRDAAEVFVLHRRASFDNLSGAQLVAAMAEAGLDERGYRADGTHYVTNSKHDQFGLNKRYFTHYGQYFGIGEYDMDGYDMDGYDRRGNKRPVADSPESA